MLKSNMKYNILYLIFSYAGSFQNYPFYYKVCKKDDPTEKPIEGSFHPKNIILFVPSEKTVDQSQASNLPARQVSQRTKKKAGFSVT